MAKGRRLTISRSERYLGGGGGGGYSYGRTNGGDMSELGEEDVWSTGVDDVVNHVSAWSPHADSTTTTTNHNNGGFSTISHRRHRRQLPLPRDDHRHVGGLSLAFDDDDPVKKTEPSRILHQFRATECMAASAAVGSPRQMATSAPVNVPDWSKIYRVDSVDSLHDSDDGFDESEMIPPHEYLARAHSRRNGGGSVFEGVGRTLKGRDLRRVRDAVWSQTGFDG